ncbi:tetratricopeptide repeat protein [Candidatus Latescibacterota bacterium]
MEIKFLYIFIVLLMFIFLNNNEVPIAQSNERAPIDSTFQDELTIGVNHVSNNRYEEALALFDSLQQVFPYHPAPNFFIAFTYQSWMLTYRFNEFQNDFYVNTKLALDKGTRLLEKNNDPWLNFYVGAAYGYKALHRFRQHNWIGAYIDGRKGINNLNTALEKLPNLYDCYYGLGNYNFWSTEKSKFIRILVFWMEDKRKRGLDQLQLSIDRGRYCPYEATHGLIIAYYYYGDYDKALALNNIAMELNDNPSLETLYMRGRLMARFEKWSEVQTIFQKILEQLVVHPYQSIGYQVECKYWIAEALKSQNQPYEAYELTVHALAQSKNWSKDKEIDNPLEGFDIIKKHLEKLHDKLEKEIAKENSINMQ